ncbi:hypothetical protein [Halorarius halobius]|uniref:hypothetical protein n=1 Tax=Halorarius halobius TaxID=2962671 RepID=UPI0020CC1FB1|nr:hypothetical protein [Halorarius halobius]
MGVSYRFLFDQMVREEWRMHSRMFGGRRFALFPAFLTLLAGGTATFFAVAGASESTLLAGLHVVVALVGLQVGSIGLVGRDALENLLGDTTLLIYAARTLPVSQRRLLLVFVVKDVAYYAVLFIAPLVVGTLPLVVLGGLALGRVPILLVTAWLAFAFGVGLSLSLVGLATRSRAATVAVLGAVAAGAVLRPDLLVAVTPYGLFQQTTPGRVAAALLGPVALGAVGMALFSFDRRTPARTAANQFRALHRRLGNHDPQGLLAKSLLDVARSSGGLWKVLFSQGLVFGVIAVLLLYIPEIVPVRPSPGLTLSTVLALGAFTTYNWLCQFEDEAFFGTYPIDLEAVFRAKLLGYLLVGAPAGLFYLALGVGVFGLGTVLLGAAVYLPVSVYVFGVTAYVAGLRPTELLFDTPVFALFSVAMMAVLLPLVVLAIAYPLDPALVAALSVGIALVAGGVGYALYRRAADKWHRRARRGTL